MLNYYHNMGDITESGAYPVGASIYGALDMAGNVWEWVADWYDVYPGGNPNANSDFGQTYRVLRGGGWNESGTRVRSAYRHAGVKTSDSYYDIGFRCALSIPAP